MGIMQYHVSPAEADVGKMFSCSRIHQAITADRQQLQRVLLILEELMCPALQRQTSVMDGYCVIPLFPCSVAAEILNTYYQVSTKITVDPWRSLSDQLIVKGPFLNTEELSIPENPMLMEESGLGSHF